MLSQAVLTILFAGAIPAVACTPKLDVTVTGEHHSPVVRSTYDVDAIRALAVSTGQPLRHGALGFYIATVGYEVELAKGMLAAAECSVVTAVVRLSLGPISSKLRAISRHGGAGARWSSLISCIMRNMMRG
jgi:hypothetical protein